MIMKKTLNPFKAITRMNLHTKLLLSYLVAVLLPVVIVGSFMVNRTIDTVLSQTDNINYINFQQLKSNMRSQFSSYIQLSTSILAENELVDYIEKDHSDNQDYLESFKLYNKLYTAYSSKLPISTISSYYDKKLSIYTSNPTLITDNSFILPIASDLKNQKWFKDVIAGRGETVFLPPHLIVNNTVSDGRYVFAIGRVMNPFLKKKYVNVLHLQIPESEIYSLIDKEGINKRIYILNRDNIVMSSTDRDSIGKDFTSLPGIGTIISSKHTNEPIVLDNRKMIAFYDEFTDKSAIHGCKIVSISSSETMVNEISSIIRYTIYICSAGVIITIFLVVLFSNTLTGRVKMLVRNMSKIRDGKFEVFIDCRGEDEIGELSRSFKSMIDRMNHLITEVYVLDIRKKEAEIHALQSQINPHFLFNTMESIRMNLWNKQDYETSEILQKFSKLLRKSIDWSSDRISLANEIDLVETYLKIQKFRYEDKLDYRIDIDEALNEYVIPKFTLQPIAENAIYHGIEMKKGRGILSIYTRVMDDTLRIYVEDDGVGMDPEQLKAIRMQLENNSTTNSKGRVGISNVHQRVRLQYGDNYGLHIESKKDKGTRIEIILPLLSPSEVKNNV
jgi:two-component system, sensor histidine kinase YesM